MSQPARLLHLELILDHRGKHAPLLSGFGSGGVALGVSVRDLGVEDWAGGGTLAGTCCNSDASCLLSRTPKTFIWKPKLTLIRCTPKGALREYGTIMASLTTTRVMTPAPGASLWNLRIHGLLLMRLFI